MKQRLFVVLLFVSIIAVVAGLLFWQSSFIENEDATGISPEPGTIEYTTLAEYNNSIDYSCEVDTDCEIKDVHNCCGAFPKCVNKNAQVDPDFVREVCAEEATAGICGFPVIEECGCQNNVCVAK